MDKIVIQGIPPYDGEYEFDLVELVDSLTNRELHRIKVMSGVRAGELFEALTAGDNDLVLAFTIITLERAGRRIDEDALWDAPAGSGISFDIEERSDSPPEMSQKEPSLNGDPKTSSGDASMSDSEKPVSDLSLTGHPV